MHFSCVPACVQGDPSAAGGARTLRRASSERQRHSELVDTYDAAAVAVDMVSLERSTGSKSRPGAAASAAAAAAAAAGSLSREGLSRAGSRGLAARSVGMAGLYGSGLDQQSSYPGDAAAGLPAGYRRAGQRASPNPELKSLSTRSSNPHLPPVAPVAPSLATISTGLAAYSKSSAAAAAAAAAVAAADGSGARHLPWGASGKADRSLAASSVPVAGIVAAAAAASLASKAQQVAADSTGGGSSTGAAEGSAGGGIFRSSIGIGRFSRRSGKLLGRSVTDDEECYSDTSRPSEFGQPMDDGGGLLAAMGDADLADARSWLVTGVCVNNVVRGLWW